MKPLRGLRLLALALPASGTVYRSEYRPRQGPECSHPPCDASLHGGVHAMDAPPPPLPSNFSWAHVNGVNYLTKVLNQHLPQCARQ